MGDTMTTNPRPLRLQDHEIADARRLLAALRDLSNPLPSFLYDRYLAPAIEELERALFDYEIAATIRRARAGD